MSSRLMKLIIQIPCYNEEKTLPDVLKTIPKKITGISSIAVLVIDDGSSDKTIEVAKKHGVKHFVIHKRNQGLAKSFKDGLDYSLDIGADIIVNTDGDNQYPQQDIGKLVQPILDKKADIVVADRQTSQIKHFSPLKKYFQRIGSHIVNKAAGTNIPDAVSGFRAYSKEAALQMVVINSFSYCTETIIHAGRKKIAITSVPVKTNPPTRKSRLFKNMWHHMYLSGRVILKSYFMYQPIKMFFTPAFILCSIALIPFTRYLFLTYADQDPGQHIQSLIAGTVLFITGFLFFVLGILADLIRTNRRINEDILYKIRKQNL